ncbi:[Fe-Fe] hydrogenase large subunit C-terminal domain-containing protein [Anaerocolumna sp. MB42-C2]|uniref:[Fe-Fe] hydrogenase large subunit C-terminal domain-containing protein n=1 Tax=Anaerocolumna sp. MB42-C2 TaxID=3070997 RepID=UPI0027E09A79|nr:[Fe-Fe] hydrogenase large subunit C-terminal domain-containing protein [Anaerocolumna sp. MB42-C2]WMJ85252.1 [Fe-Fe] hydrogenase large subunit C-terminal domain-containing protein [Anaerocolumna sp. MB42-C2]
MNVIGFKEAKCRNCYKCVRTCEVKAITVKNEQAQIMNDKCILCGQCLEACPQNAKTFISDLDKVKGYLRDHIPTVISIAPAYLGILKYKTPGQVITALMKLGFSMVRETAEGAAFVTKEYEKLLTAGIMDNIITTCCPSVNDLIEIYYPSLTKYMAPVDSPMIAHGKLIRKELGHNVKIVFLGPCIAKKREAESDPRTIGFVDAVINFPEVEQWLKEENIDIMDQEDTLPHNPNPQVNRLYPISSGVLSSVVASKTVPDNYRKFYVHGLKNCIELFESMERGEVSGCFIEADICNGGCIKGSAVDREAISRFKVKLDLEEAVPKNPLRDPSFYDRAKDISFHKVFLDRSPKDPLPSEEEINHILSKIGKTKPEDELNCGACGYVSCREKAIAVYQGKAELTMCIPYMHEKAQSMANVVLDTTPNIIILVDSELKIVEFSGAAENYFHVPRCQAIEMYLYEIINHTDFLEVLTSHSPIMGKKVEYPEIGLATLQNIVYVQEQNAVLGIFQDITLEEEKIKQAYKVKVDTIEMAQKVIDKQMLVAQQIAGLLGETTAETKVTLTKLRDTILYDGVEQPKKETI